MTDHRLEELLRYMREKIERAKAHPEERIAMLKSMGVLDENSKVSPLYEDAFRTLESHRTAEKVSVS